MRISMFLLLLLPLLMTSVTQADDGDLEAATKLLAGKSFDEKSQGIQLLARSGHEKTELLLKAILAGDLFYVKKDQRIVFAEKQGSKLQLTDAFSGEDLGLVSKRKAKKISINNSMRRLLRLEISNLTLKHPDLEVRLKAVDNLMGKTDTDSLQVLESMLSPETDARIITALKQVMAFDGLDADDPNVQLDAIEQLDGHLHPQVLLKLKLLQQEGQTAFVRNAAAAAVKKIESRVSLFETLETLFFGLSLGSILALAAIGLAITFGVMGVINMAHGELIMIGAYTTYVVQLLMPNHIGWSIAVAIPAAFMVSALVGIAIERGVIRFLYGRPLETLLATFGISLFLQQAVRSIFSPLNRSVETPAWMSGSLEINSLFSITYNRLYIFIFCLVVFLLLYLVMKKTSLGLHVRAVSQNRNMARAMGIRSEWVDAMTFGLGSGIAGVAGVALSQITNVGPNLGQAYIVDSFMVVVFGGVGNLWGTLISGLSLGVVNKYLEPVTGAVLAKILVLIFIILFIQKRPRGLFPQKGRAAEA